MNSANIDASDITLRPRSAKWFAGITWALAAVGLIAAAVVNGVDGLLTAWPLLVMAYLGWWVFWYPSVQIDDDGVTLHNLLRSVRVPWSALIHVDTKFALTLITTRGKFTAWAAPAPGVWGTHRGKPEHVRGLPATTYGAADSIRPGDLKNTDSGAAAYHVRSQWAALAEAGKLDVDSPEAANVTKSVHWLHVGCAAALVAACFLAFAVA
ncbi:PH domain-containing protein [Arthrobacter castelli]|uniref:PH domain-containing protein n=1 Tax=Arthrobacter castelli TaxID=271431 RepID=UPI00040EBE44|nr:PH domain-containing protein [Arthrobacter castelli]